MQERTIRPFLVAVGLLVLMPQGAGAEQSTVVFGAFDTTGRDHFGVGGFVHGLNRDLGKDGFLIQGMGAGGRFAYVGAGPQLFRATGGLFRIGGGYQMHFQWARVALYAGYQYRSFSVSPDDPDSQLARKKHGAYFQTDGFVEPWPRWGAEFNLSYTAVINDYWTRIRPYYRITDTIRLGPELSFFGGRQYDQQRYGAFVGGVPLGPINLGFKAGVEVDSSGRRDTRGYGGIEASFTF